MAETMGFDDEGTRRAHDEIYAKALEGVLETCDFKMGEEHAIAAAIDALRRPSMYRHPIPAEDMELLEAAYLAMGVRSDGWVKVMSMLCARIRDYAELNARRVSFPKLETDPAADDAIDRVMAEHMEARQAKHDAGMQKLKDAVAEKPPYVPPKPTKRLTKNAARCTHCKTVVQSKHRQDWVSCKCGKIFVDGGLVYQRFGFSVPEDFEDLSEWAPIEPEPEKP